MSRNLFRYAPASCATAGLLAVGQAGAHVTGTVHAHDGAAGRTDDVSFAPGAAAVGVAVLLAAAASLALRGRRPRLPPAAGPRACERVTPRASMHFRARVRSGATARSRAAGRS